MTKSEAGKIAAKKVRQRKFLTFFLSRPKYSKNKTTVTLSLEQVWNKGIPAPNEKPR